MFYAMFIYGVQSEYLQSYCHHGTRGLHKSVFQVPDSAVEFEHPKNMTVFWPYFTTNIVEVHREVEAFSFGSLVADVGGVLGLFIGFNFLMLWDWIVLCVQKCLNNSNLSLFK